MGSYPDIVKPVHSSYDSVGFQLMGERARERDLRIVLVQGVTKAGNKPWLVNPNAASHWMLDGSLTHLTLKFSAWWGDSHVSESLHSLDVNQVCWMLLSQLFNNYNTDNKINSVLFRQYIYIHVFNSPDYVMVTAIMAAIRKLRHG